MEEKEGVKEEMKEQWRKRKKEKKRKCRSWDWEGGREVEFKWIDTDIEWDRQYKDIELIFMEIKREKVTLRNTEIDR